MVKRILTVIFLLVLSGSGFAKDITIAVLDFDNNSIFQKDEFNPLKKGLAEIINTRLGGVSGIKLVERRRLSSIFDEIKLSQSGMVSEDATIKIGKLAGAKYLVFGSFIVVPKNKIRIDVRIVNVETGITAKAEEITGKNSKILYLSDKLCRKIVKNLSKSFDNIEFTESGSYVQNVNFKAMLSFSKGVEFQEKGDLLNAITEFERALEYEHDFKLAKQRLEFLQKTNKISR